MARLLPSSHGHRDRDGQKMTYYQAGAFLSDVGVPKEEVIRSQPSERSDHEAKISCDLLCPFDSPLRRLDCGCKVTGRTRKVLSAGVYDDTRHRRAHYTLILL